MMAAGVLRRRVAAISAGVLALTVLAGCGAGGTSQKELVPVKIQLSWVPQAEFAGFYVAKDKGYYKAEGLDVEIVPGGPDIVPEQQVANGSAQFGVNLVGSLLSHIEQGVPLVQIGQIFQDSSMVLVTKKASGIDSPQKFAGKKIGNWMGGNEYEVLALLSKYGYDPLKDVKFMKQGFTMDQFFNGELDVATAMIYNEYHVVLENGYKPEDLNIFKLDDLGVGMLHDNLFVNKDWLAKNEDLAVKFTRASMKGWKDAVKDVEGAAAIVMKSVESGSTTREHQVTMMQEVAKLVQPTGFPADQIGFTNEKRFQLTADIALQFKVIKQAADVKAAFTNDIVKKAAKGG